MARRSNDKWISGDWNAICDVCKFKYKASELRMGIGRQKGLRVCEKDWDEDHPQDHIKAVEDDISVPWSRPEPEDQFGAFTVDEDGNIVDNSQACDIVDQSGVVGIGAVGCAIVGYDPPRLDSEEPPLSGTFSTNNGTL